MYKKNFEYRKITITDKRHRKSYVIAGESFFLFLTHADRLM